MIKSKCIPLLSIAAATILLVQRAESSNATYQIDWDLLDDSPDYRSAAVGETVEFIWNGTETLFLYPKANEGCNPSNMVEISEGESSAPPVNYTFKPEDAYTEVLFTSNITADCQAEESITFAVTPSLSDRPTDCGELRDNLDQCLANEGYRAAARLSCQTCISTSFAGSIVAVGVQGCLGSDDDVCKAFVGCPCDECMFEAVTYGSCRVDTGRGEDCPITDCAAKVAEAGAFSAAGGSALWFGTTALLSLRFLRN